MRALASTFSFNYVSVPVLMVPLEEGAFQKGAQTIGVITFTHRGEDEVSGKEEGCFGR